jgi:hypothetical protein
VDTTACHKRTAGCLALATRLHREGGRQRGTHTPSTLGTKCGIDSSSSTTSGWIKDHAETQHRELVRGKSREWGGKRRSEGAQEMTYRRMIRAPSISRTSCPSEHGTVRSTRQACELIRNLDGGRAAAGDEVLDGCVDGWMGFSGGECTDHDHKSNHRRAASKRSHSQSDSTCLNSMSTRLNWISNRAFHSTHCKGPAAAAATTFSTSRRSDGIGPIVSQLAVVFNTALARFPLLVACITRSNTRTVWVGRCSLSVSGCMCCCKRTMALHFIHGARAQVSCRNWVGYTAQYCAVLHLRIWMWHINT